MTTELRSGFEEIDHTADVSLKIWGETINDLFLVALKGLYHISGVTFAEQNTGVLIRQQLKEPDLESLLVSFLSECNYLLQFKMQYLEIEEMSIDQCKLKMNCQVFKVKNIQKEIKAVTFHQLEIVRSDQGYSAQLVFDV